MNVSIELPADHVQKLRVDGRGRVTIPKDIRDDHGIEEGDRITVAVSADE